LEVVEDPDLTIGEKRSILAAWASDARSVENKPALRQIPGRSQASIDDILNALRLLDKAGEDNLTAAALSMYRKAAVELFSSRSHDAQR
jgi:hypothetical protein